MLRCLVLTCLLALAACGDGDLRSPPMGFEQASVDRRPRQMRVLDVHDLMEERIGRGRNPHVSHLVEVEVLAGPEQGCYLTLPYDEWSQGRPPPAAGSELTTSPSAWLARDPRSNGRPYQGWGAP